MRFVWQAAVSLASSFFAQLFWQELGQSPQGDRAAAELTRFVAASIAFTAALAITVSSVGATAALGDHFQPWPFWTWLLRHGHQVCATPRLIGASDLCGFEVKIAQRA